MAAARAARDLGAGGGGYAAPAGAEVARGQRREELGGGLEAVGRVLAKRLADDRVERGRQIGHERGRRRRRVVGVLHGDGEVVVALERQPAGQHLEQHDAGRVQVGALVGRLPARLFGRQVARGAHHDTRRGQLRRAEVSDPEVGHLDPAVPREQDVLGGHVAVDDAAVVSRAQGGEQTELDVARHGRRQAPGALDELLHGLAGDVLHDDVRSACRAAAIVDGDHVGMVQGGGRARLAMEARYELVVIGEPLAQDLHRHQPPQRRVLRQEDLGHAAAAQPPLDPIAAGDQPALRNGGGGTRRRRDGRVRGSIGRRRRVRGERVAGGVAGWIVGGQTGAPRG